MWELCEDIARLYWEIKDEYWRWRLTTAQDQVLRSLELFRKHPELRDEKWLRRRQARISELQQKLRLA